MRNSVINGTLPHSYIFTGSMAVDFILLALNCASVICSTIVICKII